MAYAIPLKGVVLEEISDNPIPYAYITYASGKELGQCDVRGRFEVEIDSRNAILVFKKNGYDSLVVEMQDYADLLDVVVNMRSDARHLGSATVVGGTASGWQNAKTISVQKLEDAAGLRFDLTEHLSQMPGMSGQMDFSGNLFYDGSRSEEIAYHLGELRVPNMRHLDIGFPGNLSVINPQAIESINVNEHYGASPFNQGLAGSIQFEPKNSDEFKADVSLGTALRSVYMEGPWLFWDGFAASVRMLDPSMLKNMGEKFFTEFKKQGESCDDCSGLKSNPFSLSSMDAYARFFGKDSSHNAWSLAGLYSSDKYSISQDTSKSLQDAKSTAIIKGSQVYSLASAEYKSLGGTVVYAGVVSENIADTLRDTSSFRKLESSGVFKDDMNQNFIDGYEKSRLAASLGISWEQTDNLGFALLYNFYDADRKQADFAGDANVSLSENVFQGNAHYEINSGSIRSSLGAGGLFSLAGKQAMPLASIDIEKSDSRDFAVFGNAAWRSDWSDALNGNELKGKIDGNASAKAGARLSLGGARISAHGFGRYYPSPALPTPRAFEHYRELQGVDCGWVYGSQIVLDFHSLHRVAFQSNFAHVRGRYELPGGGFLPWQANSKIDMVSHLRIYPRSDSLLSLILSHRAALGRPLYEWSITPSMYGDNGEQIHGERHIKYAGNTTSLFRTDVRLNLDLKSSAKYFMLDNVRFFLEANNIFSSLDIKALRFLGDENGRERSIAVRDADGDSRNGFDIVPFMAKGMGLYIQFGVEGSFK